MNLQSVCPAREELVAAFRRSLAGRLVAIVSFGSRARREAEPGSDWDLLVVIRARHERPVREVVELVMSLPESWRGMVSPIVWTLDELERHESSLLFDIALDGEVLFDPEGHASRRLEALRARMFARGLFRVRTPDGEVWRVRPRSADAQPIALDGAKR